MDVEEWSGRGRIHSARNGLSPAGARTRAGALPHSDGLRPRTPRQHAAAMRFHTYSKFSPEMADQVDLQALLDKLADFLLQSGFAGGSDPHGFDFGDDSDRSLDALRQAIIDALMASGQFTAEMLKALRGEGTPESPTQLAKLLDDLVQRLVKEGYLNVQQAPQMPAGHEQMEGPGSMARA